MNRIIFIIFLLISSVSAESVWKLEGKAPMVLSSHQISSDGSMFASLYVLPNADNEEELQKQYMQIGTVTNNWWLSNTSEFFIISKMNFIDNTHLLIIQQSSTSTVSSLINIQTRNQLILSNGNAEYITEGKNKGLFMLHNRKGYFTEGGAYWVDELKNSNGELIEVYSKPKNKWGCIALKFILDKNNSYPLLRQSLDDCIYVDR